MLKVNELMVGDWVKVIDHFEKWMESLYVRVEGLNDTLRPLIETEYQLKGREAWASIRYEPEHIEPIPLTEDILKANGFSSSCLQILKTKDIEVEVCISKGVPMYVITDIWNYCLPHPTYVHELQHALRLCGLNELADNFKIK